MVKKWSPVEDTFLIENNARFTREELAKYLRCTVNDISARRSDLSLSLKKPSDKSLRVCFNPWCKMVFSGSKPYCCNACQNTVAPPLKEPLPSISAKVKLQSDALRKLAADSNVSIGTLNNLLIRNGLGGNQELNLVFVDDAGPTKNKGGFNLGFRKSLGVTVRSSWENNVLHVLNHQGIPWEYEPQLFHYDKVKRGTKSYLPDIRIPNGKSYKWIEIKGRLTPRSRTQIRRFKIYYPQEFAKLEAITQNPRVESTKFFESLGVPIFAFYDDLVRQYSTLIKEWE